MGKKKECIPVKDHGDDTTDESTMHWEEGGFKEASEDKHGKEASEDEYWEVAFEDEHWEEGGFEEEKNGFGIPQLITIGIGFVLLSVIIYGVIAGAKEVEVIDETAKKHKPETNVNFVKFMNWKLGKANKMDKDEKDDKGESKRLQELKTMDAFYRLWARGVTFEHLDCTLGDLEQAEEERRSAGIFLGLTKSEYFYGALFSLFSTFMFLCGDYSTGESKMFYGFGYVGFMCCFLASLIAEVNHVVLEIEQDPKKGFECGHFMTSEFIAGMLGIVGSIMGSIPFWIELSKESDFWCGIIFTISGMIDCGVTFKKMFSAHDTLPYDAIFCNFVNFAGIILVLVENIRVNKLGKPYNVLHLSGISGVLFLAAGVVTVTYMAKKNTKDAENIFKILQKEISAFLDHDVVEKTIDELTEIIDPLKKMADNINLDEVFKN